MTTTVLLRGVCEELQGDRSAITHEFSIGGNEGFLVVCVYEDGRPGEIRLTMMKEGSTVSGFADSFAAAVTVALQHGAPLGALIERFRDTRFEPSGFTTNRDIPMAKSVADYVARWLELKFPSPEGPKRAGGEAALRPPPPGAPDCDDCGEVMVRDGSLYRCLNCGA